MSREKGSCGEREVAKLLEPWWRKVEPECVFVRTPLSGGWGGKDLRAGFKASGDLMTTAEKFPFTVEVKRREAWKLDRLLEGKASPVWGWWRQAIVQGEEMQVTPMLWLRQNRKPWLVMLPEDFWMQKFFYRNLFSPAGLPLAYDIRADFQVRPRIVEAVPFLKLDPWHFHPEAR